jgi:hypothetical protein
VAAALLEANHSLTPAEVELILRSTARPVKGNEPNNETGVGLVSSTGAIRAVGGETTAVRVMTRFENSGKSPAIGDLVQLRGKTEFHGTTNLTGAAMVDVNENTSYEIGYYQYSRSVSPAFGPRDGVPDIYSVGNIETETESSEFGTIQLPAAQVLNISVVKKDGAPLEDATVRVQHQHNRSSTTFSTETFSTSSRGLVSTPASVAPGIEVAGSAIVTVEPPTESNYSDHVFTQAVTVNESTGNRTITVVVGEQTANQTLVVNKTLPTAYQQIQPALDTATDGDRVVISQDTYQENITVAGNISIVAPSGAILEGEQTSNRTSGIVIKKGAPRIAGLTVEDYSTGVDASATTGSWSLQNMVIRYNSHVGVNATKTTGNWLIQNTTLRSNNQSGSGVALAAEQTTGRWEISESILVNHSTALNAMLSASEGHAIRNYWGASDGPSGDFDGRGNQVFGNVTLEPFFTGKNFSQLSTNPQSKVSIEPVKSNERELALLTVSNVSTVRTIEGLLRYNTSFLNITNISTTPSVGDNITISEKQIDNVNGTVDFQLSLAERAQDVEGRETLMRFDFNFSTNSKPGAETELEVGNIRLLAENGTPFEVNTRESSLIIKKQPILNTIRRTKVPNGGSPLRLSANASAGEHMNLTELRVDLNTSLWSSSRNVSCDSSDRCSGQFQLKLPANFTTWNGTNYETLPITVTVLGSSGATVRSSIRTPIYAPGDITGDGKVDILDAVSVGRAWRAKQGTPSYTNGADLDNNGVINVFDAVLIGRYWQNTAPTIGT